MSTTTFQAVSSSTSDPQAAAAAAMSRKRSRATMMLLHEDDDQDEGNRQRNQHPPSMNAQEISHTNASATASTISSPRPRRPSIDRKRSRTSGVLDGLELVPAAAAWQLNMDEMLDGVILGDWCPPNQQKTDHLDLSESIANGRRYVPGQSIVVLCVVESTDVQLRQLSSHLPHLLSLSPTLFPILLTRHAPSSLSTTFPAIPAKGHPANHFLRLGLLHPLGGGLAGMDALVLLDQRARRRLVVPFGWGVGRGVGDAERGAHAVRERLMEAIEEGLLGLEREREAEVETYGA
ncbi:hypothetical protein IWX90DRAFT_122969 [Phyllosticta citrichinensis]|uniref:Uncharacterized protein n=1 Tax=Phyllosticta citrichinensis TaxID=1130410 RepID=A0ABR1Y3R8_9PEZI